jgi:antitoxin PrlF
MATTTLTSKGQLTLPRAIRDHLRVDTGDAIEFIIDTAGEIRVRAGSLDVKDLRGALRKPGRKPVSLAAMDEAILTARGRRP